MSTKRTFVLSVLFLTSSSFVHAQNMSDDAVRKEIMRITNDAIKATYVCDRDQWNSYLADDYLETDESGLVKTKKQVVDDCRPLPIFADPRIEIDNVKINVYGTTALMFYRGFLRMTIGGQKFTEGLQLTDVYMFRDGRWQLTAEHQSRFPMPVEGVKIDEKVLRSYAGAYQIMPLVFVNFYFEKGKLWRQSPGIKIKDELTPENETTFFIKGQIRQIIFEKDASGKVVSSVYRLPDGQMVRAKKVN